MKLKLSRNNLIVLNACANGISFLEKNNLIDLEITYDELLLIPPESLKVDFLYDVFNYGFTCDEQGRVIQFRAECEKYDTNIVYNEDGTISTWVLGELTKTYNPKTNTSVLQDGETVFHHEYGIYGDFEKIEVNGFVICQIDFKTEVYFKSTRISTRSSIHRFTHEKDGVIYIGDCFLQFNESTNEIIYGYDGKFEHKIKFDKYGNIVQITYNTGRVATYKHIYKFGKLQKVLNQSNEPVINLTKFWKARK